MNKNITLLCLVNLCSVSIYCIPYYLKEQKAPKAEKALYLEESKRNHFAWSIRLVQICPRVKREEPGMTGLRAAPGT